MKTLRQEIQELHSLGNNRDGIYEILVGNINLYGKAFFSHKASKSEKQKMTYRWKLIMEVLPS